MGIDSIASSRPFYTVQVNLQGCAYGVRVNDGPVYHNAKGLPLVVEFPINRWTRNGANEVSLHLRPMAGQSALNERVKCTAIVYLREKDADRETRREVARLEYPKSAVIRSERDETVASAQFSATVPFPLFRWFTSPEFADGETTLSELMRELENFHTLLAAKDIDGILAAVRVRDVEDAAANYTTMQDQVANSRREYSQFLDSRYELRPLITNNVRLRLYGNRRLARAELLSNGQPPLYYLSADRKAASYMTLIFSRDSLNKWVIIR
ncbi:MAG: hypothetical protein P4K98_14120 [Bryobacteraceae bacterium]|nr:hypothetical protein [Bryobacteraceae bacterium]